MARVGSPGGKRQRRRSGRTRPRVHAVPSSRGWPDRRWAESWAAIEGFRWPLVPVVVIALNLAVTLYTGLVTLRDFPNSADEYAYLISAQLFAEGKLSVPSPTPPEFFHTTHMVNDGKYYGKYPPGWPGILMLGVLVRAPWIVNPLLGALTVALLYVMARRFFARGVAAVALVPLVANPFFIFNSASYFSHASCLFFITLFMYGFLSAWEEPERKVHFVVMGLAAGMALLIRPFTAVAALAPFALYLGVRLWRTRGWRTLGGQGALAIGTCAVGVVVFVGYNYLQTGDPLRMPFVAYNPIDTLRLTSPRGWMLGSRVDLLVDRLVSLTKWVPLAPLLVLLYLVDPRAPDKAKGRLLALSCAALLIAHFFLLGDGGHQYGPRYIYESLSAVVLLMALAVSRFPRAAAAVVALVVLLNVSMLALASAHFGGEVERHRYPYELVKARGITNGIVFLTTGSGTMRGRDLIRNGIHFDGPVLYVRSLGEKNERLLERYPGRPAYVFAYDYQARTGSLRELTGAGTLAVQQELAGPDER